MTNSTAELRDAIESKILHLEAHIRALKFEKNALAPINGLPTEVLSQIFLLSRNLSDGMQRESTLLNISHVCKSWRTIAINSANLWTIIDCSRGKLTEAMLERAATAPLNLSTGRRWHRCGA